MNKMQFAHDVSIVWNEENNAHLSIASSSDSVLEQFFSMQDWDFIRHCHDDIYHEQDTQYADKRIEFLRGCTYLYVEDEMSELPTQQCLKLFSYLYDLMMVGANDNHHSVRYEPWWHEFIELSYQLKRKLELQEALQEGIY